MRLTLEQQQVIKSAVKITLGGEASVWLFGSRVNDALKGGDIDLYVEFPSKDTDILRAEMSIYSHIINQLGDQRIDIVMHQIDTPLKAIHEQARKTGIRL